LRDAGCGGCLRQHLLVVQGDAQLLRHQQGDIIGTAAALAKRRAKQSESGFYLEPMLPGKTRQFEAA